MKIIELRPDSKLLKNNFDGYKLSLESIPVLKLENIPKPDQVLADSSEYSFLHSSLFQLHNHLVADPWLHNTAYYLDTTSTIQKVQYENKSGKLKTLQPVFRANVKRPTSSGGIYNCVFKFVSEKFVLFSDGIGNLKILETGERLQNDEWKLVQSFQSLDGTGFILQDAKLTFEGGEKTIHCLLLHIEQLDGKFQNVIDWITLKQSEGAKSWEKTARRTIQGKGHLHYLSFDPKCKSIVYSSNHAYKYVLDTVNEIVENSTVDPAIENLQIESVSSFKWNQNGEEVSISFNKPMENTKDKLTVNCLKDHIEVKYEAEVLIDSDLFGEIDIDLTTWTLDNDLLQVNLIKKDSDIFWPYLVPGGPSMDLSSVDSKQIDLLGAPVSDLNAQMEECDFGDEGHEGEEFFIGE